jgi:hypothetical protein
MQRKAKPDPLNAHVVHMPTPLDYRVSEHFRFVNRNVFLRLGSAMLFYLIGIPVLNIISRLFLGLEIKGLKGFQERRFPPGGHVGSSHPANGVHVQETGRPVLDTS